jgi:outer membrane protein assembly factor BamB
MTRALLLALAALAAACSDKGPVREPADLTRIESPAFKPRVLWDASPGSGGEDLHTRLRLSVTADLLVTADVGGDVFALDPKTGRRLWRARTGARIAAGPTVAGPLVLAGTLDAEVLALNRADGSVAWRVPVSSEVMAPPASDGSIVVVRCGDGKVFGLSAANGGRVWSFDRAVPALTLRGLSAPLIEDGVAYIGLDSGRLAALRIDTGEELWEEVVAAPSGRTELERIVDVDADPLVTAGGIFAVSFGGELAAISLADGRVAWRRPIRSYSGVALSGSVLAASDDSGVVWALDAQSGASVWKQEALKYRKLSAPLAVGGHFVVADYEGYLHWLSPQDGRIVARVRAVREPVNAPLAELGGVLYVLGDGGDIAAVTAPAS